MFPKPLIGVMLLISGSFLFLSETSWGFGIHPGSTKKASIEQNVTADPAVQVSETRLCFPQFAHAPGLGITSEVMLSNLNSAVDAVVRIEALDSRGVPLDVTFVTEEAVLTSGPGFLTIRLPRLCSAVIGATGGDSAVGSLHLTTDTPQVTGALLFQGDFGVVGVPAMQPAPRGVAVPWAVGSGVDTGVAVTDMGSVSSSEIFFFLLSPDGRLISRSSMILANLGQSARFLSEMEWDENPFAGYRRGLLVVQSSQPFASTALRITPGVMTTLPVQALPDDFFLPGTDLDDHGNSCGNATVVTGNSETGSLESPGDVDFFSLQLATPAHLVAFTEGTTDTFGLIMDETCQVFAGDDDGGEGLNFRMEREVEAGTYYVSVRGYGDATGPYLLRLEATDPLVDDHGNNCATATYLGANTATGVIETGEDTDVFRIVVSEATTLTIFSTGRLDSLGQLLDSSCQPLMTDDDSGQMLNFRISLPVGPGTYYIAVSSFWYDAGEYTVHVLTGS